MKRKTRDELAHEVEQMKLVIADLMNVLEKPEQYHMRILHEPNRQQPGLAGAKAIYRRAQQVIGRNQA